MKEIRRDVYLYHSQNSFSVYDGDKHRVWDEYQTTI